MPTSAQRKGEKGKRDALASRSVDTVARRSAGRDSGLSYRVKGTIAFYSAIEKRKKTASGAASEQKREERPTSGRKRVENADLSISRGGKKEYFTTREKEKGLIRGKKESWRVVPGFLH